MLITEPKVTWRKVFIFVPEILKSLKLHDSEKSSIILRCRKPDVRNV